MKILHCPDVEPLVDALAETLLTPLSDPFAREIIVVPTLDIARHLQRELSRHLGSTGSDDGIVANIDFVYPRQIINLPADGRFATGPSPWDAGVLVWEIVAELREGSVVAPGSHSRVLAVAGRSASLFDRYATHRPQMLAKWAEGQRFFVNDDPSLHWQVDLYQAVRRRLDGRADTARAIDSPDPWRHRLAASAGQLPERINVFGVDTLGRAVRDVLEALAEHIPVTVHLVHPRSGTLPAPVSSDTARGAGHVTAVHPLLSRWGTQPLEAGVILGGHDGRELPPLVRGASLLHRLQQGIIDDIPMEPSAAPPGETFGDGTVQVHACYGRTRQAEALRDALMHILATDPRITARDIAIMCPDVSAAAPVLASTFAGGGSLPGLPISATSGAVTDPDPLSDAFDSLLGLLTSRCSASEIVDVLRLEPVSRTFGLDAAALERVAEWTEQLAVRFGLDGDHRERWSVPRHVLDGTWEAALRQLMMGIAVPADTPVLGPGGIVPFDGIEGSDLVLAGSTAEFLRRLRRCITEISGPDATATIRAWCGVLGRLVDDFLSVPTRDAEALAHLRESVDSLRRDAVASGLSLDESFSVTDLVNISRTRLVHGANSYFSRGEAITVAPLGELRHVPFEVVCIFDANEDAFAGARLDGDDVLAREPMVGEPIYASSGRLHLLDAVMAARSHLVVTCDGFDMSTNREMPLPVPLAELLEVVDSLADGMTGAVRTCAVHPRHNFDDAELSPGLVLADRPFTHDPNALAAHEALRGAVAGGRREMPIGAVPDDGATLEPVRDLAQLVRLASNPVEYHYRDVLNVRLPAVPGRSDDWGASNIDGDGVMHLTLDALDESAEGRRLLAAVASSDEDPTVAMDHWATVRLAAGALPPERLGELITRGIRDEIAAMIELLPEHLRSLRGEDIDCDLVFNAAPVRLRVTEVVAADGSRPTSFARMRYRRFSEVMLSEIWTELAVLTIARGGEPIEAHLVARGAKSGAAPVKRTITLRGGDAAERLANASRVLSTLEGLHRAACLGPVPLFATASPALHGSTVTKAKSSLGNDLQRSAELDHVYGAFSPEEILAAPVLPHDRDLLGEHAPVAASRARLYAEHLWGNYDDTVDEVVSGDGSHDSDDASEDDDD